MEGYVKEIVLMWPFILYFVDSYDSRLIFISK